MKAFIGAALTVGLILLPPAFGQGNSQGQRPAPRLAYVYPAGAQQGSEVTLSIGGQNLTDSQLVRFSNAGITARITGYERPLNQKELVALREEIQQLQNKRKADAVNFSAANSEKLKDLMTKMARGNNRQASPALAETVTVTVTVAPDVPVGAHELRLQSPNGLSNPLVFQVGVLPEFTAPVVTPTSPGVTRGKRAAVQQPSAAPPTQIAVVLPAVVNGQILAGEVDRIQFSARQGQSLVVAASARALIPYLADAVPGWFQATLTLRDAQGRELAYDDDFQFRPDPVLVSKIPADGDYVVEIKDAIYRGREDFVYRVTIGEVPFIQSVFPLGTKKDQPATVQLTGWNLPATELPVDPRGSPSGMFHLSVRQKGIPSNTVRFAIDDCPEVIETAFEASGASAPLTPPLVINGRVDRPDDRDVFPVRGHAGEQIVAEVFARRLDSPLDSALALLGPDGQSIAFNDDFEDPAEGLLTHQADSRLTATLPQDGIYQLVVTDTQHHGGPEYGYRLVVRPLRPEFSLRVTPSAVNLPSGASVPIKVFALRQDGFTGEIQLALRENPRGYRLSGAVITAGQDATTLTLTAPTGAGDPGGQLHLVGMGTIQGKPVLREAMAADDTMQAFLYKHLVPAKAWEVMVSGRGLPLRLTSNARVQLTPGQPTTICLALPGPPRGVEDLKVELSDPPAGISVGECHVRNGQLTFTVLCEATGTPAVNPGNLIASVYGQRPGKKANAAKAATLLGVAPAIPFEIKAPVPPIKPKQ
jgi:antitoxin component of MazEF toxin-antitoxin module